MCTLLTVSYDFYVGNREDAVKRITTDSIMNGDGFSLILCGSQAADALSVKVMNVEAVLSILDSVSWTRMWLHSRLSTTGATGLDGCHGFHSNTGYLVQHNGVISAGNASTYPVDSMIIAELLKTMIPEDVASWIHGYADYANVFIVNPSTGTWFTVRSQHGTLFTDGSGNYSSHPIGSINKAVQQHYVQEHKEKVAQPVKSRYYHPIWSNYYSDGDDLVDREWWSKLKNKETVDNKKVEEAVDTKFMEDMKALALEEGWTQIPYEHYRQLTKKERKALNTFIKESKRA